MAVVLPLSMWAAMPIFLTLDSRDASSVEREETMVSCVRVVGSVRAASWISAAGDAAADCHLLGGEEGLRWRVRDLSWRCARGLFVLVLGWMAEVA